MEFRCLCFALSLILKFCALCHLVLTNNDAGHLDNNRRLLYFTVKPALSNIKPDGNGFLWCLCYDAQTRRHIGLRGSHTYIWTLKSLILISGDVSPNPGAVKYPCAVCNKPVT